MISAGNGRRGRPAQTHYGTGAYFSRDQKRFLSGAVHCQSVLRPKRLRAAASLKLDPKLIAGKILKREELGSTGVGGGIAIPHARIHGVKRPFGLLDRMRKPIEFDAIDGEPVDIVFLLLLPAMPARPSSLLQPTGVAKSHVEQSAN